VAALVPGSASLDPADWDSFRATAHAALDRALEGLRHVADGPVWRPTPAAVRDRFTAPLPRGAGDLEAALGEVDALIAPFVVGNIHPRFFGWAQGAGTPVGVIAELIAAALNANCGGRDHVGPIVERQIALWAAEAFGFPATSSGIFVTGASQANFLGLLIARDAALGHGVRLTGLKGAGRQLCAYASAEAHGCVRQAMELSGVGADFLRRVETGPRLIMFTHLSIKRRYSEAELKAKMEQAGFQVEQIIRFNRVSRPAWFVSGRILKRRSLEWNQMRLYDRFVWLWRRIDKLLPWRPTAMIASARRP